MALYLPRISLEKINSSIRDILDSRTNIHKCFTFDFSNRDRLVRRKYIDYDNSLHEVVNSSKNAKDIEKMIEKNKHHILLDILGPLVE